MYGGCCEGISSVSLEGALDGSLSNPDLQVNVLTDRLPSNYSSFSRKEDVFDKWHLRAQSFTRLGHLVPKK